MISKFSGKYRFLSNFFPAPTEYDGIIYPTSEHAYQAAKTLDPVLRYGILTCGSPGRAKSLGKHFVLRPDWDEIKIEVMASILYDKFTRNLELRQALIETGDEELIEGNTWGDQFWGVDGTGHNWLGKLLMKLRGHVRRFVSRRLT